MERSLNSIFTTELVNSPVRIGSLRSYVACIVSLVTCGFGAYYSNCSVSTHSVFNLAFSSSICCCAISASRSAAFTLSSVGLTQKLS
ncbi:MAG: hypothetical protein RMY62_017005 [Nostoc sp. ZfuVER08]|uniref:Uncharacterized protein n=1 Tax=Nostoc punctiforme FACHB-252 TaxID=1357509 RepID=A0ABR8H4S8_NOSPU|nr:hypothetical protein [Nostoc punctiforme]MBD2610403.1 hypothetical protein [Nostoc punctiforme FACHB-252]MDZ8011260.1 hypothetical protein [Nostoc sp. ZfuVER08]